VFFSIVLPTYNRAERLVKTVQSILTQDFTDFELIIVDDGSTDNTLARVADEFGSNPKVRYHRKKNEERSVARNFGMKQACGDYIVFFDSDDFMHKNHLSILYEKILLFPDCNFFATKFCFDYGNRQSPSHLANVKEGFYDYKILLSGSVFGTLVCVKRSKPFLANFPPEFNICEDWIFNFLNLLNDKIYLIDQTTITVIEHEGRSMAQNRKVIKARLSATEYLLSNLNLSEDDAKEMRAGSSRFCAVHSYLDGERNLALRFIFKIIALGKFRFSDVFLLLKILLGKNIVNKLRG
jgi:GalNAc5-diNAcBac-PP-undecaprenol beta-1,3-glucosyltransferase